MLSLRGLSRRYGRTVALDGLSLEVPKGEVVGFVGPNGAGKTTAMRIALGVLEADDGEVLWRGEPATREAQRTEVGDPTFFRIMRRWYRENRYGNVTTADFIALSERVLGQQLGEFFSAWLYEEGRPAACDA